jgi:hypothetical protein
VTARSRTVVPRTVTAALLVALAVSGCSGDGDTKVKKSQSQSPVAGTTNTHDGALPIAVVSSWMDAVRQSNGDVACAYSTETFRAELASTTQTKTSDETAACVKAVATLAKSDEYPTKTRAEDGFTVVSALDEATELTVKRPDGASFDVSLVSENEQWLIDSITPSP